MLRSSQFNLKFFLVLFTFSLVTAGLVQLWVLPQVFPALHAGSGILLGDDSLIVHQNALKIANRLSVTGFEEMKPLRAGEPIQWFAGLLYWLIYPSPLTLVPFQALAHSLAGLLLFILFSNFGVSRKAALISTLPFLLSLSGLNSYTQLLKGALDDFGVFLYLVSWVQLLRRDNKSEKLRWILGVCVGQIVTSYTKPYLIPIFWIMSGLQSIFLCLQNPLLWPSAKKVTFLALAGGAIFIFQPGFIDPSRAEVPPSFTVTAGGENKNPDQSSTWTWKQSSWLFSRADRVLEMLAKTRRGYLFEAASASSSIDTTVMFSSAGEVLAYLPRALQIAILAPFPNQWFNYGQHPASRIFRTVGAVETLVFYFMLVGLGLFVYLQRPGAPFWFILLFCVSVMLIQSFTIINMGTLTRHRFPYQSLLNGFGILGYFAFFSRYKSKVFAL